MEGNFLSTRGMYAEAALSYLKALDYEDALPYAEFGLGSAYLAMDEGNAALERFAAAGDALKNLPLASHRELIYRLHYNRGMVFFAKEDYKAASQSFRAALEIDGSRIEAKRNLELSLLSRTQEDTASPPGTGEDGGGKSEDPRQAVLFDYLRHKERNQWRSREWIEEESPGPDY
jgi:Ca-activated chloride channel family protein